MYITINCNHYRSTVPKRSSKQKYTTPTNRRPPVVPLKSDLAFHRLFGGLLNRAVKVERRHSSQPFQSQSLASPCTSRRSVTLYVCVMKGPSAAFHLTVSVMCPVTLSMHSAARRVHSPASDTAGSTSRVAHGSLSLCRSGAETPAPYW